MMASHTTHKERFEELQNARVTRNFPRPYSESRPKIQRVPEHLRNRKEFMEHYLPRLVSIGPIHHGSANLKLGDKYKLMWAALYLEANELIPNNLYKKIADKIGALKGLFDQDVLSLTGARESLKGFRNLDEKLSWMLFVDGCSLLYILVVNADSTNRIAMNIKFDQLVVVMRDVLLLENQLPYPVLKLLWKNDNEPELINIMKKFLNRCEQWVKPEEVTELEDTKKDFLRFCHWATPDKRTLRSRIQGCFEVLNKKKEEEEEEQHSVSILNESELPTHLLDLQRKIILTKSPSKTDGQKSSEERTNEHKGMITYRNIQDLRAIGIKFKSSSTRRPTDIDFFEGWFAPELILPEIVVDDATKSTFLNLTAYEMCPDFDNDYEISSFVVFMDSLIDHPEDVRKLRSEGILLNCLGSDEEVAKLFNIICTDLVQAETYFKVRVKINKHYNHKCKTWIALGIHTYFNNPWTFTAFLAAFIALALTFIQTWFTINPPEQKK
ncbi:hypothetical protein TSUD_23250 [Trifolium subterraneum]|uniref:Uncharacterized protein n=1 Tax=Trifolium subterraneum TaxID=3900 RepID=A0A2Z6M0I4_TRISU|nr:hypothetical protein TSUD_23250 [Trifolium subterraneum]